MASPYDLDSDVYAYHSSAPSRVPVKPKPTPTPTQAPAPVAPVVKIKPGYKAAKVRITTGSNPYDGMLGKARIEIIGETVAAKAEPATELGYRFWESKKTLSGDIQILIDVNPTVIVLYNDGDTTWYVDKVEVETAPAPATGGTIGSSEQKTFIFPCYSFLDAGQPRIIFIGNSRLPSPTPSKLDKLYRERALDHKLKVYQFEEYNDLSRPWNNADRSSRDYRFPLRPYPKRQQLNAAQAIPVDDNFDMSKQYDFETKSQQAAESVKIAGGASLGLSAFASVDDLINELFTGEGALEKPIMLSNPSIDWKSDKEFGRQAVAGINPVMLTLIDKLPESFVVSDADLGDVLPGHCHTLQAAIDDKRVFLADYSGLQVGTVINSDKNHLYAPRCLFLRDEDDDLIPIAVELERGKKVYTRANDPEQDPSKTKWKWTLAKAYVASADSSVHQVGTHFLNCHAACEVYLIALRRRLSEWHPLFKLLIPHVRFTMAINLRARRSLINAFSVIENFFGPGPMAMQCSVELFKTWRFKDQALPENLKLRGVYDKRVLPYYPYRDAGMLLWKAIHKYVLSYLKIYYGESKAAISQDMELNRWWNDVKYGLSKEESPVPIVEEWPKLESVDDLAFICSTIIWTASAQHSAVNFSQYDYTAFAPNRPSACRKPMPETVDEKVFMEVIPSPAFQVSVTATVDVLTTYSEEEEYIAWTDQPAFDWLVDPAAKAVYKQFVVDVDAAQAAMKKMNDEGSKKGKVPYTYMLPRTNRSKFSASSPTPHGTEGVPNSVAV